MSTPTPTLRYYKVLKNGKSPYVRWPYPLPQNGKPGEWCQVEGPLVEHHNGFHLTSKPLEHREKDRQCYEVEIDGDSIGGHSDLDLVVRRVRLTRYISWAAVRGRFDVKVKGDGVGIKEDQRHETDSPALILIRHVWNTLNDGENLTRTEASWRTINSGMQDSLNLAISSGMRFNPDDFAVIAGYSSSYWLHWEQVYSCACGHSWSGTTRNPNPSAYQALEMHLGRRPFIILDSPDKRGVRTRLHEGRQFVWHVDLKTRVHVKVTSIVDKPDPAGKKGVAGQPSSPAVPYVVACSYKKKEVDERGHSKGPDKIDRMFKITHEDIAEYHKAIREHAKNQEAKAS